MDVLNLNSHPVPIKLKAPSGATDWAHVAAKRRVTLPAGYIVDINWLAVQKKINTYESPDSNTPIVLRAQPLPASPAPAQTIVATTTPAPAAPDAN